MFNVIALDRDFEIQCVIDYELSTMSHSTNLALSVLIIQSIRIVVEHRQRGYWPNIH